MGRAFSLSLAAHAAVMISFLLLSATRQPLVLPPLARQVRLVTYLEPAAAPRSRPAVVADPAPRVAPPREAPPREEPRAVPPPAVETPDASPAAVQVPRVVIPVRGDKRPAAPPSPSAEARPALSERLARRLAAAAPAESRPDEVPPPRIASLPRAELTAPAASAVPAVPATPGAPELSPGAVVPVGYFPHAWYLGVLKEKIYSRWAPPSEFFKTSRPPTALVAFRIDRAGRIGAITMKEGSGSARFDQSALAAIRGLGQVPALPEQYPEESLDVVIRFQNQR